MLVQNSYNLFISEFCFSLIQSGNVAVILCGVVPSVYAFGRIQLTSI